MTFTNGIIEGFTPKFKSINKDCDRYFDALASLSEDGSIQTDEVLKYTSPGYLWIYFQYIENGYSDAIVADLKKDVTDRDFYGALFENTRLVLDRLMELSEHENVINVYKAAILHRLKAFKEEHSIFVNPRKKCEARNSSKKWLKHYLPTFEKIVSDYEKILSELKRVDPDIENYLNYIQLLRTSLRKPVNP